MLNLITGLQVTLIGMASVFIILLLLFLALHVLRYVFYRPEKEIPEQEAAAPGVDEHTGPETGTDTGQKTPGQTRQGPNPKLVAAMIGALAAFQESERPALLVRVKGMARFKDQTWINAARMEGVHRWGQL